MSMHRNTEKQPIPAAVLVPARGDKPEQPTATRKAGRRKPQVPWVHIVAGGSIVWFIVVAVMALYAAINERTQTPAGPVIPAGAVVQVEQALPPVEVAPAQPVDLALNLPVREVKQGGNDGPAPLAVDEPRPVEPAAPAKKIVRNDLDPNLYASCEQIGTNVLFMKDPPQAFKRAAAERKMVFMVHLSGNLEDKDFT